MEHHLTDLESCTHALNSKKVVEGYHLLVHSITYFFIDDVGTINTFICGFRAMTCRMIQPYVFVRVWNIYGVTWLTFDMLCTCHC